jgi:23S rRNA pseudouridine1911/1915/1917 synthase
VALNRQALHAHTLGFIHPEPVERLTLSAPMPDDMWWLVEELRSAEG